MADRDRLAAAPLAADLLAWLARFDARAERRSAADVARRLAGRVDRHRRATRGQIGP